MKMIDFLIALSSLVSTRQIILFTKAVIFNTCGDDYPDINLQHLDRRLFIVFFDCMIHYSFDY